ncbi:MAG: hypothetical protein ACI9ST_001115 [Psychrobacter glaciei]|jgi:hypothetical protein|uniref:ATP-binding protein n=1 Tax=Psychrobacter glaciei TaxID=619771 RepID=A0ABQ3GTC9_9GAMM|nr:DUF411 domain-containing protein [Psychrobacter glaciei]GHD36276.1 hypothetical protein GCM10016272_23230 [Psychrobacter glaciei]
MRHYTHVLSNGHSWLSGRVLLLVVTSSLSLTLAACSQSNTSGSDSQPVKVEQSATQNAQVQNESSAPTNAPVNSSSSLLKNVSATVYKDANCGCCKEWVGYAEGHGLSATAQDVTDLSLFKERYGVPQQMRSCHTTVTTDGFVFEGHVPAKYMAQFLANPPTDSIGLAVPSMPVGSPGMEYQDKFMPYKVMQLNKDGSTQVYAAIESPAQQL